MEKFVSSSNKKGVLTRQSNLIADLKFAGALRGRSGDQRATGRQSLVETMIRRKRWARPSSWSLTLA